MSVADDLVGETPKADLDALIAQNIARMEDQHIMGAGAGKTRPYRESINLQRSLYKTVVDRAELFVNVALYGPRTDMSTAFRLLQQALAEAGRVTE
jgi:hypothetical protein